MGFRYLVQKEPKRTYVDRRVVLGVHADRKVNPLVLWGKVLSGSRIALDNLDLVGGANAALEKNASGAECTSGQDHTTVLRERDKAVRANSRVISLDTNNLRAIADDVGDEDVILVGEVRPSGGCLEVGGDGTTTLAVYELRDPASIYWTSPP
jgi:hypothetical protein